MSDSTGHYRYDARPVDTELAQETLALDPKGYVWSLPDKAGDYLVTLAMKDGTELGQIPFTIAGNRLAEPGQEPVLPNGSLRLVLDKEHYTPGDTIHFQISAPFAGCALATLERDRVEAHSQFTVKPGESVHEITIPKDFEGRGYLNVSLVRDSQSEAIYMDPHAYAVQPFTSGVKARDMGIRIEAPEKVLPGEAMTIKVHANHPGRVQLFVVDEGILQLTNFALPDPLRDLLTERALDVVTREAYHLLMPDHERLLGRIPGFGGGMGGAGGRFINPFRRKSEPPFAFWSKLLDVNPSTPATCTVAVPAYFGGSFRVMAVGSSLDGETLTAGCKAQQGLVRGNVIIKPELPLVVAPGDVFSGSVILANTVEGSGKSANVAIEMRVPDGFTLVSGSAKQTVNVPENAERVVPFSVKVNDQLGAQDFSFKATLSGKPATMRSQSVSVRPASGKRTTEQMARLQQLPAEGDNAILTSDRELYPFEADSSVIVSEGSLLGIRAVLDRLNYYPYGCTEQKISQAMPYVVLWDRPALRDRVLVRAGHPKSLEQKKGKQAIADALRAIRSSMQYDGISLWPGGNESNLFVTAYAGDFLVTMHEHGLFVPEDLLDRVLSHLEEYVGRTPSSVADGRIKIYGAWVLQRSGRIMTAQLTNLENWFSSNTRAWEKDVLASLLAESFASLRLTKRAEERLPDGMVQPTTDSLFSTGMAKALHALILEHTFDGAAVREQLIDDLTETALSQGATTVDLAMISRALAEIASKDKQATASVSAKCLGYAPGFNNAEKMSTLDGLFVLDAPGCTRFCCIFAVEYQTA